VVFAGAMNPLMGIACPLTQRSFGVDGFACPVYGKLCSLEVDHAADTMEISAHGSGLDAGHYSLCCRQRQGAYH
jgi:hypothetical protein